VKWQRAISAFEAFGLGPQIFSMSLTCFVRTISYLAFENTPYDAKIPVSVKFKSDTASSKL